VLLIVNVTPTLKNLEHPLDKIFGGILAGSSDFTHASVMHYHGSLFYDHLGYPEGELENASQDEQERTGLVKKLFSMVFTRYVIA